MRGSGYEVECVGEDDLTKQSLAEAPCLVYSMARSEKALSILTEAEEIRKKLEADQASVERDQTQNTLYG